MRGRRFITLLGKPGIVAPPFNPGSLTAVKYWLDAGTIAGVADGAAITAAKWVDQSLSAKGALATATNGIYRAVGGTGKPAVEFNGTTSVCVSPALSVATPRRVFLVAKYLGSLAVGSQTQKFVLDGGALNQGSLIWDSGPAAAGGYAAVDADSQNSGTALFAGLENIGYLFDMIANGASSSLQVSNQTLKAAAFANAATYTAITLGAPGNLLGGFFGNQQVAELIVCDSTLTGPQATQIRSYLIAKHSIITRKLLICDGNSLTVGQGSTGGVNGWVTQIAPLLSGGAAAWNILNNGTSGQTTPQMDTQASPGGGIATTDVRLGFYAKTIVTGWEITNDILTNSVSAATGFANVQAFFNHRRAASAAAKLVVMTCLPRTTITGANETARQTINANIVANFATFADAILDVASLPNLTDPTNVTYYADGTHLTDAGYAIIAAALAPILNAL